MTPGRRSGARVGVRLRRWAEEHCCPEVVDSLILPVVADLQYEDAATEGNALGRWWSRMRNYAGLARALGLHLAIYGRIRMTDYTQSPRLTASDLVRMGVMLPLLLVVLASAGYLCKAGLADILYLNGARGDRVMWAWSLTNSWAANVISGALLAAMFVAAILWAAPPAHRAHLLSTRPPRTIRFGLYSLIVLWGLVGVAWGGNWAVSASHNWLHFNFRPLVMGLFVLAGGVAPFWLARRACRLHEPAGEDHRAIHGTIAGRRPAAFDLGRVGLMIPGALLAAAAVEVLVVKYARTAIDLSGNRSLQQALYASAFWIASPFMAAAFAAALCRIAPPARRVAVAIGAGGAVVLWGALLVFGSVHPWAGQPGAGSWPLAMGPVTWVCGAAALSLARRVSPAANLG